jgi:hypothetical protein
MSETYVGTLTSAEFGVTTEAGMIVEKSGLSSSAQLAELADEQGDIKAVATYGIKNEYDLEFTISAAGFPTDALVGAVFTAAGAHAKTYIVTEVVKTYTKADWLKGSLKGVSYPGVTV